MIASIAKEILEAYNNSLVYPKPEDVYPYIYEYAKKGSASIKYSVRSGEHGLAEALIKQGYTVEVEPTEFGATLTISWAN